MQQKISNAFHLFRFFIRLNFMTTLGEFTIMKVREFNSFWNVSLYFSLKNID